MNAKSMTAALGILSALSFSAFAAESITAEQAQDLQPIGTVTASGIAGSPMDIHKTIDQKADRQDAKAYRVVEAYEHGNGHATAELYK